MIKLKITLDTRRQLADGRYPVKLYVNNRTRFYIATPFTADPDKWDGSQYTSREQNYKLKNLRLRNYLDRAERTVLDIEDTQRTITDTDLKARLIAALSDDAGKDARYLFDNILRDFLDTKHKASTAALYASSLRPFQAFAPGIYIHDIDLAMLQRYYAHLLSSGNSINTAANRMAHLAAVVNYAINHELITAYPFRNFHIRRERTRHRALTVEQIRQLITRTDISPEAARDRDIFLLMFYLIGINYIDLRNLRKSDIRNGRIEYRREKTGILYSIKIEPEAQAIISRLSQPRSQRLVSIPGNGTINKHLHRLQAGLTTYWARHSWATIAASLDIPKETISAALGHQLGSTITSIYIDFDQAKVDRANRQVIDHLLSAK